MQFGAQSECPHIAVLLPRFLHEIVFGETKIIIKDEAHAEKVFGDNHKKQFNTSVAKISGDTEIFYDIKKGTTVIKLRYCIYNKYNRKQQ